jgi:hypothetical protein
MGNAEGHTARSRTSLCQKPQNEILPNKVHPHPPTPRASSKLVEEHTPCNLPQPTSIKCDKTYGCESVIVGFVKDEFSEVE